MSGDVTSAVNTERAYLPRWLLGGYLAIVAAILLWPTPVDQNAGPTLFAIITFFQGLGWSSFGYSTLEISANVLLFIPLGVLLVLVLPKRRWWLALLVGIAVSVCGEVVQFLALPERLPTVLDVAANGIGLVIGVTIVAFVRALRAPVDIDTPVPL